VPELVRKILRPTIAGVLILFSVLCVFRLIREIPFILLLNEAGYGDSYILYDVHHFLKTGKIYRNLSEPPYLPAQYSPLVYVYYALPAWVVQSQNPFLAPRLMVLASFLGCIAVVISITAVLIPTRGAWALAGLLACSISSMLDWIFQIRGDFPGTFFSLLSLRLLLSQSRWSVPVAGICAGLSLQFKINFFAAAAAGALWLVVLQRWKDCATFTGFAFLFSAGLYFVYGLREPQMFPQMFALSPGIPDIRGDIDVTVQAMRELVVLLAVFGMPPVMPRSSPKWSLLFLYTALSFLLAALSNLQIGGNVNYYFGTLFALVPFAVLGALRLSNFARRNIAFGVLALAAFSIEFVIPKAREVGNPLLFSGWEAVEYSNAPIRNVERVLGGRHIFSTVPRVALLDPAPALLEPYLLSYLIRIGKVDQNPILDRVSSREFEAVVTASKPNQYRGIFHINAELHQAITDSYRPICTLRGAWLVHLPVFNETTGNEGLKEELTQIGCELIDPAHSSNW
jgi:hypothetical protein